VKREGVIWNLPNVLSAYRLAVLPVIVWTIAAGHRDAFFVLICVSLVTDILDGWIARRFHLETEFGARLDTAADDLTYVVAFLGFLVLERDFLWTHRVAFALLLLSKLLPIAVSLLRFRRTTSLHLYSSKATGYVQGFFIFGYYVLGYSAWYFYFMVTFSVLAGLEKLAVLLVLPELRSNARGLYWILATSRQRA
jgi:cardiolipin synthase